MLQVATAVALSLTSLGIGYWLGVSGTGKHSAASPPADKPLPPAPEEVESEEEDVADGDLSAVKASFMEPCKLVCLVMCVRVLQLICRRS